MSADTTTKTELVMRSELDVRENPASIKVTDAQMASLKMRGATSIYNGTTASSQMKLLLRSKS